MSLHSVQEIEKAIAELSAQDFEELASWFDERQHPFDAAIEADIAAGGLDDLIARALSADRDGRVAPL